MVQPNNNTSAGRNGASAAHNILSARAHLDSIWNWNPFNACFPGTRIRISDIDGVIERNGYFLILETKAPEIRTLPFGQRLMYEALAQKPGVNVLIIWGRPNKPEQAQLLGHPPISVDHGALFDLIGAWFQYADNAPRFRRAPIPQSQWYLDHLDARAGRTEDVARAQHAAQLAVRLAQTGAPVPIAPRLPRPTGPRPAEAPEVSASATAAKAAPAPNAPEESADPTPAQHAGDPAPGDKPTY